MKKALSLLLVLILSFSLLTSCQQTLGSTPQDSDTATPHVGVPYSEIDRTPVTGLELVTLSEEMTDYVLLDVRSYGKILIRLYPDVAPATVTNFKKLVSEKFYDGLIFHRVIENFMIQGGDPEGTGLGGSPDTIRGEFSSNGFENNLKHTRGVVSMARTNDPNSASSQFFICHQNYAYGNGNYAAFGYVVYGMDVVDQIAKVSVNTNDKPRTDVVIDSIRFAVVPDEALKQPAVSFESIDLRSIASLDAVTQADEATDFVKLEIEGFGTIIIRLYADVAPETVANFKKLVSENFYNGLTFHRVVKDFMIQGGAPQSDSRLPNAIPGEFSDNDFENNLKHLRGVVSMARSTNYNSATSQFFICHADFPNGNGRYAAFGYVIYGMDVVDAIATTPVDGETPRNDVVITSASFVSVPESAFTSAS